jgi:hypothetical protein
MPRKQVTDFYDDGSDREGEYRHEGQEEPLQPASDLPADAGRESQNFSREDFEALQSDHDLSPSADEAEQDDDFITLQPPRGAYFTLHPTDQLIAPVTFDPLRSEKEPYVVLRPAWRYFPPSLLYIKRFVLGQSFIDEQLKTFVWMISWYEANETPSDFHRSAARVIERARKGWGRYFWDKKARVYQWRRWSVVLGEEPPVLWPVEGFYTILSQLLEGRVIRDGNHALIRTIGEEEA